MHILLPLTLRWTELDDRERPSRSTAMGQCSFRPSTSASAAIGRSRRCQSAMRRHEGDGPRHKTDLMQRERI